jgi:uncharacterized protein YjbI with pentapeptide repeats
LKLKKKERVVDFSKQTLEGFILSDCHIRIPLLFKNVKTLDQVYFNNVSLEKEVNFEGATINGIFSISESRLKENLILKRSSTRESLKLIGNIFEKNLDFEEAQIRGYLSLNKSEILGKAIFKKMNILSLEERVGKIVGNFYFEDAKAKEVIIENVIIDGSLSFKNTFLESLSISNAKIKGEVKFSNKDIILAKIKERKKIESEIQRE